MWEDTCFKSEMMRKVSGVVLRSLLKWVHVTLKTLQAEDYETNSFTLKSLGPHVLIKPFR